MSADPRAALATLVAALERHLELAASRKDAEDPAVGAAAEAVVEAFDDYDEALFDSTGIATPLGVYGDDSDDEDEEDDDEDDEDDEDDDDEEDEDEEDDDEDEEDDDEEDDDRDEEDDDEDAEPAGLRDVEDTGVYAGLDDEDVDFDDRT